MNMRIFLRCGLIVCGGLALAGCQSPSTRSDSRVAGATTEKPDRDGKWIVVDESTAPNARPIAQQPTVYSERPELNRPEVPVHEHSNRGEGIPDHIRRAAASEAPGRVVSARHYVTSDIDVYVLRIDASDGPRELRIRQDGVVLVNRLNPAQEQAGFETEPADTDVTAMSQREP
jgi:hypothetical protein